MIDPRGVPFKEFPLVADASLAPVVFGARPAAASDGLAPPVSATHWWLAAAGNTPGVLHPASARPSPGGWTAHHVTPFDPFADQATHRYPPLPPDVVRPLPGRTAAAADDHLDVVRPPAWQLLAWSDRPGEFMTSRFRAQENRTNATAVSPEQHFTLRRARTATPVGASARLQLLADPVVTGDWRRHRAAFQPRDWRLVQTMTQTDLPPAAARLFVVDDQSVHASAPSSKLSAVSPVILSNPTAVTPRLYFLAGDQWTPDAPVDNVEVFYQVRLKTVPDILDGPDHEANYALLKAQDSAVLEVARGDTVGPIVVPKELVAPKELAAAGAQATYVLYKFAMDRTPGQVKLTAQELSAVSVAWVDARSRVKPLKTAVALLGGSAAAEAADVRLLGYGQLGPDQFSPIQPVHAPSIVFWRRTADLRVMLRNPRAGLRVGVVVTGPGGETYPDTTEA